MLARTYLIRIQRALYRRLKKYARDVLGALSSELKQYYLEYQRDFTDFQEISSKRELLSAISQAHIVFCGDYHTLSQAQRTVIRILRDVFPLAKRQERSLILALEMVHANADRKIQNFLHGRMDEKAFLESISFHRTWGFSWENYRKLFEFAREHSIRVVGINLRRDPKGRLPTLNERDRFAAQKIAKLTQLHPKALIVVLVGDLHLAPSHLPYQLELQLNREKIKRFTVVIHQNNERFYWKLVDKGLEHLVDVVKVRNNIFCVMNTPPWVKLKSHVKWAELMSESEAEPHLVSKEAFDTIDHTSEVHEIIEVIQQFIGGEKVEDDFQICGPLDHGFLSQLEKKKFLTRQELKFTVRYLREFESHFIPRGNIIYLSSLSLNHAAAQSTAFLHSKWGHYQRVFMSPREDYYPTLWHEALCFFGSKVINHKRKCNGPADLKIFIEDERRKPEDQITLRAAQFAIRHLQLEDDWKSSKSRSTKSPSLPDIVSVENAVFYLKAIKLLGQMLGNALYVGVMRNQISRDEIQGLFFNGFQDSYKARALYIDWIRRLDVLGLRNIVKREQL